MHEESCPSSLVSQLLDIRPERLVAHQIRGSRDDMQIAGSLRRKIVCLELNSIRIYQNNVESNTSDANEELECGEGRVMGAGMAGMLSNRHGAGAICSSPGRKQPEPGRHFQHHSPPPPKSRSPKTSVRIWHVPTPRPTRPDSALRVEYPL